MKKWDDSEIKKAINYHNTGNTFNEIGIKLDRTEKAIKEKLSEFNLKQNKKNYYEDVICENCGKSFTSLVNEKRKYCSQSCAAIKNNSAYPKRIKQNITKKFENKVVQTIKYCLNCGCILKNRKNKFCSHTCHFDYKQTQIFNAIERNEYTDDTQNRYHKKYLIHKHGEKCMKCGWDERNMTSGKVPIELEHIDGNSENNNLNNLILLCPNCHSLTPTYRALNVGKGRHKRRERYKQGKSF